MSCQILNQAIEKKINNLFPIRLLTSSKMYSKEENLKTISNNRRVKNYEIAQNQKELDDELRKTKYFEKM